MDKWRLLQPRRSAGGRWRLQLLLASLLLLCVVPRYSRCQPFSGITSYPIPQTAVPVPGVLSAADAPQPPEAETAAASSSSSSTASSTSSSSSDDTATDSSCTSNWCTQSGQWLPSNVNYLLLAAALCLLLTVLRSERALCCVLLCWSASLFVFFLVDQFVLWYLLLTVDFAVYAAVYSGAIKTDDGSEDEDEEEEEAEDEQQAATDVNDRWVEEHLRGEQAKTTGEGGARLRSSSARSQQSARRRGSAAAAAAVVSM